jgi:RNA-directed DNA polymerase
MILREIANATGLRELYLARIARTASHRYRTYNIEKRTSGTRAIDHPSRHLKFLQRWLVTNLLHSLPVHESVYSYRKGRNVKDHAKVHAKTKYTLRIDFQNFFPSIRAIDLRHLFQANLRNLPISLNSSDIQTICSIVCKNGRLTIGAPSSPALSNAVLYDFDEYWHRRAGRIGAVYSRYADDIYFSTNRPKVLSKILFSLKNDLETRQIPCLRLNEAKTIFTSRKRKRVVTGLVVTPSGKISLGRDKKRMIKTLVYLYGLRKLTPDQARSLQGHIAYARSIEPKFLVSLEKKFGKPMVAKLVSGP